MMMRAMAAVVVMHEHMHQRASQQDQERQDAQQMGAVLRKQQKSGKCEKPIKYPLPPG